MGYKIAVLCDVRKGYPQVGGGCHTDRGIVNEILMDTTTVTPQTFLAKEGIVKAQSDVSSRALASGWVVRVGVGWICPACFQGMAMEKS